MISVSDLQTIKELFKEKGCGEGLILATYKQGAKNSGLVGGMLYPYYGLMLNVTSTGIGVFYIENKDPSAAIMTMNFKKAMIDENSNFFIQKDEIVNLKVKNYNPLNKKIKLIQIRLNNGMVHYLQAVVNDKVATYNAESVENFFESYK